EGAWDEAVKGVDGIIHTATQVNLDAIEPKEIIDPAVNGVLGLLNSAMKYGSSLQRIVYTSSCAAIKGTSPTKAVSVSEADWNDEPVKECEKKGKEASGFTKYDASKTLAERGTLCGSFTSSTNPKSTGM
ncbi:hypothetical protein MPER_01342, partial [Moniliophthora perniciosa FA553]